MPHVSLIPLVGFRVGDDEVRELGMRMPGLADRAAALRELPALGLLTLAGLLPDDWTCSYQPCEDNHDQIVKQIASQRPTLVALSALTASVLDAYRLSASVRALGIPVVLGGLHATALPDEAAQHCDAVVIGDGEPVWPRVLADAAAGRLRPLYRAERMDLAAAPLPRFDLLAQRPSARFTLQTQRGCPLACDFCAASRLLGPFRTKPASRIEQELAAIRRIDPHPVIELADDNSFVDLRHAEATADRLAAADVRYFSESDWRVGENRPLLDMLAKSGCVQLLVGIESLVFRYPGMGVKQAELDRLLDAVVAIQDAGIAVNGCFIIGAEGETIASIERLVDFLRDAPLADVQLTLQTPFPGSPLYERLKRAGRLLPDRDWSHYTLFDVTYQPDRMSVAQLEHSYREAVAAVFSPAESARRKRIRRQIWNRSAS